MQDADFYIAFRGDSSRFNILSKFVDRLKSVKASLLNESDPGETIRESIYDHSWIDLLDSAAVDKLSANDAWPLEDVLDCVLRGDYRIVNVAFDGETGRLTYDPWSYPFGGTEPIKALIETFGLEITRDSFHDGFEEWKDRNAAT